MKPFKLQPILTERIEQLGDVGTQWLADLPRFIATLEDRWSIKVGPPLCGGTAAYIATAVTAQGQDVVLKLLIPHPEFSQQIPTLIRARGRGYCRVLNHDSELGAVLLEPLGRSLEELHLPPEQTLAILCDTLQAAWAVEPWASLNRDPQQTKAEQLGVLINRLWDDLDHPCPENVIDTALRFVERRAAAIDKSRWVVVHGDPHPGNALQVIHPRPGAELGFVFVDPDGFLAEPAYDLGVVLRDWCETLLAGDAQAIARQYCRQLAYQTGIDEQAIWEWGFIERVSSGLFLLQLGDHESATRFLTTAHRLQGTTI